MPSQVDSAPLLAAAPYWANPLIREYAERRPLFDQLCSEVRFVVEEACRKRDIEIAHVAWRVKSLPSILAKVEKKQYANPLRELTDIAGVRLVYLYRSDIEKVRQVILRSFDVVEEVDKETLPVDRFGYRALHFVLRLRRDISGARYEQLRSLTCELQVRTVLQDAWAIIDHHLRYKGDYEAPDLLRRRLHALAAMLENADGQFDDIAIQRKKYHIRLRNKRLLLKETVNRDSLEAYVKYRFKQLPPISFPGHIEMILSALNHRAFPTIGDIDRAVTLTAQARKSYQPELLVLSGVAHASLAVACLDSDYRKKIKLSKSAKRVIASYAKTNPRRLRRSKPSQERDRKQSVGREKSPKRHGLTAARD
jgi:ppGpp synthetase/RelA/SpoT-type nucleotidyltranferase